jgi:hypothetical protein
MDRRSWMILGSLIGRAVREVGRSRRVVFSDRLILSMYLWAVAHDRPLCWACDRAHYHGPLRPRRLASVSQFCRRVKTRRFQRYLQHLHDALTRHRALGDMNFFDGKPLAVGNYSRDPEARTGYGAGRLEKGYKLHALVTADRRVAVWSVLPLNIHEMEVARALMEQSAGVPPGAVFLADGNYDAHKLHKEVAGRGGWLFVKPRGAAEHPVTLRQMGPARRALLKAWRQTPAAARNFYRQRVNVEGTFSNLVCRAGGLGPLPAFVRRLDRVRRWVGAKLILYHLHLNDKQLSAA